jgi:hypothetical protein
MNSEVQRTRGFRRFPFFAFRHDEQHPFRRRFAVYTYNKTIDVLPKHYNQPKQLNQEIPGSNPGQVSM